MGYGGGGGGGGATNLPDLGDVDNAVSPTKGSILVPDGTSWKELAVGTDDQVLTADSAQTAGVKWAAAGGGGGAWTLLETITLAADGTFEFSTISASHNDLMFAGRLRSDRASTADNVLCRVGNSAVDSGSNYDWGITEIGTASASVDAESATSLKVTLDSTTAANSPAGYFGLIEMVIYGYTQTGSEYRHTRSDSWGKRDASHHRYAFGIGIWKNTADSIDIVQLFPENGTNFKAGSQLRMYGRT